MFSLWLLVLEKIKSINQTNLCMESNLGGIVIMWKTTLLNLYIYIYASYIHAHIGVFWTWQFVW